MKTSEQDCTISKHRFIQNDPLLQHGKNMDRQYRFLLHNAEFIYGASKFCLMSSDIADRLK